MLVQLRLLHCKHQGSGPGGSPTAVPAFALGDLMQQADDKRPLKPVALQLRVDRVAASIADLGADGNVGWPRRGNLVLELDRRPGEIAGYALGEPGANRHQLRPACLADNLLNCALGIGLELLDPLKRGVVQPLKHRQEAGKGTGATVVAEGVCGASGGRDEDVIEAAFEGWRAGEAA
jgi:hypothetical protein